MSGMTGMRPLDTGFCDICRVELHPADGTLVTPVGRTDCGGTCLACMAVAGDPEAIETMRASGEAFGDEPEEDNRAIL